MSGNAPDIDLPQLPKARVAIISSSWHLDICNDLVAGAQRALAAAAIKNVEVIYVPGSFEIPLASQIAFEKGFIRTIFNTFLKIKLHFSFFSIKIKGRNTIFISIYILCFSFYFSIFMIKIQPPCISPSKYFPLDFTLPFLYQFNHFPSNFPFLYSPSEDF